MASEPINVSHMPELLRLVEEVNQTGESRVLRNDEGDDLAVITPIASKRKPGRRNTLPPKTEEQMAAFRSAAGGWKDVDTDKLIEYIYEGRKSSKPPVDL